MKSVRACAMAAMLLCTFQTAHAHDVWLLPSSTVLSGDNSWVTVDAAAGNDKFYFNHNALRLNGLTITAADGSAVEPQNVSTGKLRSTFDLNLTKPGTYRLALVNDSIAARWEENGVPKRWFGRPDAVDQNVPDHAEKLSVWQSVRRIETFVTAGKPSELKAIGKGLELLPITHPNDLYAGESASFQLLLEGKPAAGVEILIVPGGGRYRDQVGEIKLKSDEEGKFAVKWPHPGMYWMDVDMQDDKTATRRATERRLAYVATFEVLPQ